METILVTGSNGLIGSALIRAFSPGFTVVGLDQEPPSRRTLQAEYVQADVGSEESLEQALQRVRTEFASHLAAVIHLAAYYDFSGKPSPLYENVNVRGTERLLHLLRPFRVDQFVFTSTMLVHAPCPVGERLREDSPLQPKWDYPASKLRAEQILEEERGATPRVILRIAGVYDDQCHSIPLAHQIQRIYERRFLSHLFPGQLAHGQAYVHLEDTVDAIVRAVDRRRTLPRHSTFLIGEPHTLSYQGLQRRIAHLIHGRDWRTDPIPKALAKAGAWIKNRIPVGEESFIKPWMIDLADDHYALDIGRARAQLGWEPRRSLHQTLPAMIEDLKLDPVAWYRRNNLALPPRLAKSIG